jgi:hypothetical protein
MEMIGAAPVCMDCKHHKGDLTCKAFPDGIPEEIIMGNSDHSKPFPGDNGVQFEPK